MEIIKTPYPHILIHSSKKLHGWWKGKRECTGERFLINPYNGCSVNCFFCYTRGFPGHFQRWHKNGIVTVSKDFPKEMLKQLDRLNIAFCGYLSPVSDPFQKVNEKYHYSEEIVKIFIERNIPINVTTKCRIPDSVINLLSKQIHSFAQVSIMTLNEDLRRILSPNGVSTDTLLLNFSRLKKRGVFSVARIDPIIPYVNDDKDKIRELIKRVSDAGAKHIVTSVMDIPVRIKDFIFMKMKNYFGSDVLRKFSFLYKEKIGPYLHANINYRKEIFSYMKKLAGENGVTFALCMEFEKNGDNLKGLNSEFMTSTNCDGMDVPVYIREGYKFYPAAKCKGNCLNCTKALCGIKDLAMGKKDSKKDWKFSDYLRWSKEIKIYHQNLTNR